MGGRVVAAMALLAVLLGVWRRVPVYDAFVRGARTGLRTAVSIAPALLAVLPAAAALTASGATDALCALLSPALSALRLPEQAVPLMLLRPLSGAGALGMLEQVLSVCGPDSRAGRVASVAAGANETLLYVLALYMGASGARRSRYAVPAALLAWAAACLAAGFVCP